jgi:hypothetical protein
MRRAPRDRQGALARAQAQLTTAMMISTTMMTITIAMIGA